MGDGLVMSLIRAACQRSPTLDVDDAEPEKPMGLIQNKADSYVPNKGLPQ